MGEGDQNSTKSEDTNTFHIYLPSGGGLSYTPSIEHVVGEQDAKRCLFVLKLLQLHHALVSVSDPKPTPARIAFSCARVILEVIYTPDEVCGRD